MKTNIDSVSQAITDKGSNIYISIASDNNTILYKQPITQITEKGSIKDYLTELQSKHQAPLIIDIYKPNGSSKIKVATEVVVIDVDQRTPNAAGMNGIQQQNNTPAPYQYTGNISSIWQEKYTNSQEMLSHYKNENLELRNRNQELFDKNRELQIKNDTAEAQKRLELMAVEASNKASLNGMIQDATKPETLSAIKDIIVALKSDGGTQTQAADSLLSGVEEEEKTLIETVVQLLKSENKEFISKIMLFVESMMHNKPSLDNIIDQINNQINK